MLHQVPRAHLGTLTSPSAKLPEARAHTHDSQVERALSSLPVPRVVAGAARAADPTATLGVPEDPNADHDLHPTALLLRPHIDHVHALDGREPSPYLLAAYSRYSVAFGLHQSSVTDGGDARLLRQLIRPTDAAGEQKNEPARTPARKAGSNCEAPSVYCGFY